MQQNPTGSSGREFKLEIEGGMLSENKLNCYLALPILASLILVVIWLRRY